MLIVTSKSPGFGKQKPRQYNLSHAQASVRDNCERFFGVEILAAFPLWESCGLPMEILSGVRGSIASGYYTSSGFYFNHDASVFDLNGMFDTPISGFIVTGDIANQPYAAYCGAGGADEGSNIYEEAWGFKQEQYNNTGKIGFTASTTYNDWVSQLASIYTPHSILYNYDGDTVEITTSNLDSDSQGGITVATPEYPQKFALGGFYRGGAVSDSLIGEIRSVYLFKSPIVNKDILFSSPYALLQPVAPVFYSLPSALVPRITYPTEDLNDVSITPTISWSAVTGATKYKLQVDTANTFDSSAGLPLIEEEIVGGAGLLILDSHSATYKATQKPKQWGPLSAAQSAVRDNCEEWLGVDYKSLKLCMPFWEGAGKPVDLTGLNSTSSNITNNNTGVFFEDTSDSLIEYGALNNTTTVSGETNPFIIFTILTPSQYSLTSSQRVFFKRRSASFSSGAFSFQLGPYSSSGVAFPEISTNDGSWHDYTYSQSLVIGQEYKIACNCDLSNLDIYVDNKAESFQYFPPQASNASSVTTAIGGFNTSYNWSYSGGMGIFIGLTVSNSEVVALLNEQPYRLLQPTNNRIISMGSSTPATSKQVNLAAGTTHYARVAADTP